MPENALGADMHGKTCVVTGANTGIGKEIARDLARMGALVVLACRSPERGRAALEELRKDTRGTLELMTVDMGDPASIRAFAGAFSDRFTELHALVNNAGVWLTERGESPGGIETTWAVNVLGYHLLTNLLLDNLKAAAPSRIVNVASKLAGGLDLDDPEFKARPFQGVRAYAASKEADRMLTYAFAERFKDAGVTANAMHPGGVATEIFRNRRGLAGLLIGAYCAVFARTPAKGAETASWLASDPALEGTTGKFWQDLKEVRCPYRDPGRIARLWDICERMTDEPG